MKKIALCLFTVFCVYHLNAATIIVTNTANAGANSLRDAIGNASHGDTIRFSPSLIASGSDTILLDSTIKSNISITIIGMYNATDTLFISGQQSCQIFELKPPRTSISEIVLDSLALINGRISTLYGPGGAVFIDAKIIRIQNSIFRNNESNYYGGAIYTNNIVSAGTPLVYIKNCLITGNRAKYGGGISIGEYNTNFTFLSVENSTISNNTSTQNGGGIHVHGFIKSDLIISNSEISNNTALSGGGICFSPDNTSLSSSVIYTRKVNISNSKILHNSSSGNGGGVLIFSSSNGNLIELLIEKSRISNNTANRGGGVYMVPRNDLKANIVYSTIDSNIAVLAEGGGLYFQASWNNSVNINACTFYSNSSSTKGGAVMIKYGSTSKIVNVKNSTFFKNNSSLGAGNIEVESFGSDNNGKLYLTSSIFSENGNNNLISDSIFSQGYNVFSQNTLPYSISTDQTGIDTTNLKLGDFTNTTNSITPILVPRLGSVAIDMGNPLDSSFAQNKPTYLRRDAGAAEYGNSFADTTCGGSYILPSGKIISNSGIYLDTLTSTITLLDSVNSHHILINTTDKTVGKLGFTIESKDTNGDFYQWLDAANGYSEIPGANQISYTDSNGGKFAVEIVKNGCIDTSNVIAIYASCTAYFYPTQTTVGQILVLDSSFGNNLQYTWFFGDGDSAVSHLPTHNYASAGTYNLCLKILDLVTGCTDFYCDSITVDTSGILRNSFTLVVVRNIASVDENEVIATFLIFPNPTTNQSIIEFSKSFNETSVTIIDVSGKVVFFNTYHSASTIILNTSSLNPGLYFIRTEVDGKLKTKRLIKK